MGELVLHRLAEAELWDSVTHYEEREPGLGLQFKREIEAYLKAIVADPLRPRERPGGYRRVNLKRFPYFLPYVVKGDVVWVLAVAHAKRKPGYWKRRK